MRAALAALAALAIVAPAAHAGARPVALSDARVAPTWLRLVQPHRSATLPLRLAYCESETSAYHWNGRALGAQRWIGDLVTYWQAPSGRRVTFDGLTFHNGLRVAALVAVWC